MRSITRAIETLLWNLRYVTLIPIFASIILAIIMLLVTTVETFNVFGDALRSFSASEAEGDALQIEIISNVVSAVDGYLLAVILFIFALGLYELFIGKIDVAEGSEFASRLLLIRSLDDLKDRLANVILIILIVKFFQQALRLKYESSLDVLSLAVGILLVGGALLLSNRTKSKPSTDKSYSQSGDTTSA